MNLDFISNFADIRTFKDGLATGMLNSAAVVLNKKANRAPLYLTWTVTYRCNVACDHCDWPLSRAKLGDELSHEECLRVADQIAELPSMAVTFTGGEPLVHKHILEIIERAGRNNNKMINLVTNGLLLKRRADALLDLNLSSITVSIDSHKPKYHDEFRKKEGLFVKAIEAIDYIRSKRKGRRPKILLRGTITQKNLEELGDYIDFFEDKVDHIAFQPVFNSEGHSVREGGVLFSEEDKKHFYDVMTGYMRKYPFMNNLYYKNVAKYYLDTEKLKRDKAFRCLFWSSYVLIIEPWGDAYPCLKYTKKDGILSVRNHSIKEIWKSDCIQGLQKDMSDPKKRCYCWGYNQYPSMYMTKVNNMVPMHGSLNN